tara:strand:- start:21 stop:659 length:639 start_codon:yes stop_codon:yes gene_type:complete
MDFFTSDQHFGHKNIIRYCNRPFESVEQMDEAIISRWNQVVSSNDTVYVVGDVSFHRASISSRIIKKLNGTKILIRGNHDKSQSAMIEMGFDQVYNRLEYTLPNGQQALLWHYPLPDSLISKYDVLIHGHTHCKPSEAIHGKKFNVCVDAWDFTPISSDTVCNLLKGEARKDHCEIEIDDSGMVSISAKVFSEDLSGLFNYIKDITYGDFSK